MSATVTSTTDEVVTSSTTGNAISSKTTRQTSSDGPMSIREQSELVRRYALELGPAFRCTGAARSALSLYARQFFQLNRVALAYLLLGCNAVALRTLLVAKDIGFTCVVAVAGLAFSAWDSKQGRRLRKKLEFEFFVLILGCGNAFCLLLFWPGWILIGMVYMIYLIWSWAG